MENAIQSFLQVSGVPPPDVARALLLRAKTRLAAGYRTFAQQDLLSVISSDPANQDVKAIIQSEHLRQLIFREIDLYFTASPEPPRADDRYRGVHGGHDEQELDAWHYQRSADILTRILVDPAFASQTGFCSFFNATMSQSLLGMLINSLPTSFRSFLRGITTSILRLVQRLLSLKPSSDPGTEFVICWVLATSTDPDDIASAASLIHTIAWSPNSDITYHWRSVILPQRIDKYGRTALRMMIAPVGDGFICPSYHDSTIWRGQFMWTGDRRTAADFDWLVDYLVHCSQDHTAMGNALLALSAMKGLGTPLVAFAMQLYGLFRTLDWYSPMDAIQDENVRQILLTKFSPALLTAICPTRAGLGVEFPLIDILSMCYQHSI
ncbi:hypothetical protein F4604DRAFT_1936313 [Suillus subluteus]|nr:hypothetical protein F4604DRAFT_1936313 [Suillus subluteus]